MVLAILREPPSLQSNFEVIIRQPGKPDRVVALVPGITLLGRADECDLPLQDLGVSRRHARLHIRPDQVFVEDLNSGNGTWLRGRRIEGTSPLRPGEVLQIDPFSLELRRKPGPSPAAMAEPSGESHARVDVIAGPRLAQSSYLVSAGGLSIGRSENRDLVLLDPAASRHHCDILLQNGHWRLVDNGSSNGVYLNDERVLDARLSHGDVLRIGNSELRFIDLGIDRPTVPSAVPIRDPDPSPMSESSMEWSQELSLPLPTDGDLPPLFTDDDDDGYAPARTNTITHTLSKPLLPWLPVSLGFVAVGLVTLASTLIVGIAVLLLVGPRGGGLPLPADPPPSPPSWELTLSQPQPDATVTQLFDRGVQQMRKRDPAKALEAFYQVLVVDPGNRAAERLSYTAGEHVVVAAMEQVMKANREERTKSDAERDELLRTWPRASSKRALKERFRDDPIVLKRTGWPPSEHEVNIASNIDNAMKLANEGSWAEAVETFAAVLDTTNDPVLKDRARLGQLAARRSLAAATAGYWREGVAAQVQGDFIRAKAAFDKVLELDPNNPSALARQDLLRTSSP
ncbi:MAG: FHA domain-containing protein [Deltaproteobacteria bacterium]|nr:MAG: FHA domain-containing protein [Deltaproteobacteria bacterium]